MDVLSTLVLRLVFHSCSCAATCYVAHRQWTLTDSLMVSTMGGALVSIQSVYGSRSHPDAAACMKLSLKDMGSDKGCPTLILLGKAGHCALAIAMHSMSPVLDSSF